MGTQSVYNCVKAQCQSPDLYFSRQAERGYGRGQYRLGDRNYNFESSPKALSITVSYFKSTLDAILHTSEQYGFGRGRVQSLVSLYIFEVQLVSRTEYFVFQAQTHLHTKIAVE